MFPSWDKYLTTKSTITGIAIDPATKWIIAHSSWASPNFILILDSNAILKGAFSYAGSPLAYNINSRNILLGYDSATSAYKALVQTILSTNNGYKLFSFTFSSSSSAPTF